MIDIDDYGDLVKSADDDIERLEILEEELREIDKEMENLNKVVESELQRWAFECRKRGHINSPISSLPKDLQTEHDKIQTADDAERSRLRRQSDKARKYRDALRAKLKHNFEWDEEKALRRFKGRLSENVREFIEEVQKKLVHGHYFFKPEVIEFMWDEYPDERKRLSKLMKEEKKEKRRLQRLSADSAREARLIEQMNRLLYDPFYSMPLPMKVKLVNAEDEVFRAWEEREYFPHVTAESRSVDSFLISQFGTTNKRESESKSTQSLEGVTPLPIDSDEHLSCFISHSSKDNEFVHMLYSDLERNGVRCWYAPEDLQGGKKVVQQITEAIHLQEKLLLVLSVNSIGSEWVATEIKKARKREREEGHQVLFPIRLTSFDVLKNWELFDSDAGSDLAEEVRSYFIPDFSNWRDESSYRKALDRLLSDLKTSDENR